MSLRKPALLALEDGTLFRGESIGSEGQATGEVVFNTAMTGYQEILSDPSYCRQIVTLTYPHIGNVGCNPIDDNAPAVVASGLIIREVSPLISSWRSEQSLEDYLRQHKVVGICGIDTRRLTRKLREQGALNGCIMAGDNIVEAEALAGARAFPGLKGMDLAKVVTTPKPYEWCQGRWVLEDGRTDATPKEQLPYHVVAYDYGIKRTILRVLVDSGCRVTVVPAQTSAEQVLAMQPDGVFLSNGPGDPEPCDYAIRAIAKIVDTGVPVFGICLGHQLLALASGAKTVKMKFGHHGANHPVQDLATGRVLITSQNHGFAVDEATLPSTLRATHKSLFDGSLQGVERTDRAAFSFQGHPEAGPGPHDVIPLFKRFVDLMISRKDAKSPRTQ
ncbi:MAG TPA: glutamine-hydrolyzing carbamoyl-phosphate synthase small subunit [Gammaproteobacteria bacterium]|nr:glutamine-hydrolyzing carbamoyl-phosphate synthase small subunit [Gammaproteobacteria bacterium]